MIYDYAFVKKPNLIFEILSYLFSIAIPYLIFISISEKRKRTKFNNLISKILIKGHLKCLHLGPPKVLINNKILDVNK